MYNKSVANFIFKNASYTTVRCIINGLLNDCYSRVYVYESDNAWGVMDKFDLLDAMMESGNDLEFFINLMVGNTLEI